MFEYERIKSKAERNGGWWEEEKAQDYNSVQRQKWRQRDSNFKKWLSSEVVEGRLGDKLRKLVSELMQESEPDEEKIIEKILHNR